MANTVCVWERERERDNTPTQTMEEIVREKEHNNIKHTFNLSTNKHFDSEQIFYVILIMHRVTHFELKSGEQSGL